MNPFSNFGPGGFDPSKMDPKVMMELSQLIQRLPAEHLNKMQTLMHNAMAGLDVRAEMEEFERGLPPGFREKLMGLMAGQQGAMQPTPTFQDSSFQPELSQSDTSPPEDQKPMNLRDARITLLRAVAEGRMSPEEAEKLL